MTHFYDWVKKSNPEGGTTCQCPLRLMTHFYLLKWSIILKMHQSCQCPLRLMTHFYNHRKRRKPIWLRRVNALSGWWLISTVPLQKPRFYAVSRAYFCRYLSEYSDRSSFSCMFTIWTHLTRQIFPNPEFTIAQNYSSVILFFHQNYRRTHSLILSLILARSTLSQHLHPLPMDYN